MTREYIRKGAPKPVAQMTLEEIPPVAISWGRTNVFPTGSWRNITPRFVNRLPNCRASCPVGNDIEGWLRAYGDGRQVEAITALINEQPLPAVCGRVCYHPCELVCNRAQLDQAVGIRSVERVLGTEIIQQGIIPEVKPQTDSGGRILVVGSGPAGLSAAWTLTRLGHTVKVLERAPEPGGLLRYGIPAYRLPREVLDAEIERLRKMNIEFQCQTALKPGQGLQRAVREYDAIFLAPGAAGHRSSGVTTDQPERILNAIDFLTQVSMHKPPELGQRVVIVGGGNSAIDAARTALRCGAEATIIYRRTRAEMPAYHEEIEVALSEGVKIEFLAQPLEIRSDESGNQELICQRNKLGKPDDSGRRRPEAISGREFILPLNTLIDAVGEYPDKSQIIKDELAAIMLEAQNPWGKALIGNVWMGGDFSGSDRTVAHAIGAGKRAGLSIDSNLMGRKAALLENFMFGLDHAVSVEAYFKGEQTVSYDNPQPVSFEQINPAYFETMSRQTENEVPVEIRHNNFNELAQGLDLEQAQLEAGRCFHCGDCDSCGNCHVFCPDGAVIRDPETRQLSFDLEHCKGCGICASECPRSAIIMEQ